MKRFFPVIFVFMMLLPVLASTGKDIRHEVPLYPAMNGSEEISALVTQPPYADPPAMAETDVVGDTFTIGTTWYDQQHNGTCGRMVVREPNGWLQFCWMKGENSGASIRHVWWNGIDPNGAQVFPGNGVAVESSQRGGFCTMDVDSTGRAFIAYHYTTAWTPGGLPWTTTSVDLISHYGAFLDFMSPTIPGQQQVLWPKIQVGKNGRLHIVSTQQVTAAGNPQRLYYLSGTFNPSTLQITYDTWTLGDWTQTISADMGVSPVNNRIGMAWSRSRAYSTPDPSQTYTQLDNDIFMLTDADGLNPNFSQAVNLTNFTDQDTFRAYADCNIFFDHNNYAHVAFTTRSYFDSSQTTYWNSSIIWHWSEQWPDSFRVIANYWNPQDMVACGAWNVKAQRPSMGQDPATGNLYCLYQVFDTDTMHLSAPPGERPSGEVYVSVSTDGGMNWSVGTNVTQTITPHNATPGQSWSELCPTLAKLADGCCHIEYVVDKDAGDVVQTEGTWTNNPVKYHRVPVALIPTTPLVPQNVHLHVGPPPAQPDVAISIVPLVQPVVIPANGGSFSFYAFATNNGSSPATVDLWTRMQYPNGTYSTPLLGPRTITLAPGTTGWFRTQYLPATAPAGNYTYFAYIGTYPGVAWDTSAFPFTKSTTADGGPWITEAYCTSEPFPGEEIPLLSRGDRGDLVAVSPNPFNPTTAISYRLQAASGVSLQVYDTAGRLVSTLIEGVQEAGVHEVRFDGSKLAAGVYFVKMEAGSYTEVQKLMLVK